MTPFSKTSFIFIAVASTIVNGLILTSPLFMLLVYDVVIPARSTESLVAFLALVGVLLLFYGALDFLRGRVMARAAAKMQFIYGQPLFENALNARQSANNSLSSLDSFTKFLASPLAIALIDIVWSPIFVFISFIFHPLLGAFSLFVIALSTLVAFINAKSTKKLQATLSKTAHNGQQSYLSAMQHRDLIQSLSMTQSVAEMWSKTRVQSIEERLNYDDKSAFFSSLTKSMRLFAQSGVLGLGAYLVIQGELAAGTMIAGSILLGRTLTPIDLVIGQFSAVLTAKQSWHQLQAVFETLAKREDKPEVTIADGKLSVTNVYVKNQVSQKIALNNIRFEIAPGAALGVIGPCGSGKSTLAELIARGDAPLSGQIELGGVSLARVSEKDRRAAIGYLPQTVECLEVTIWDAISRFDDDVMRGEYVIEAAKRARIHEMIMRLPEGYDTKLKGQLSKGQLQRLSLARAIYRQPKLVILDEPCVNLDSVGVAAFHKIVREFKAMGTSFIIIGHQPNVVQDCDEILILEDGRATAYGDTHEILQGNVVNMNARIA